jgi:arylsulfatase A-like enzyme
MWLLTIIMKAFIIVLKGANTAFLPCYGNNWTQMPNMNVIAAQSLVLDHYYCSSYQEGEIRKVWLGGDFQTPHHLPTNLPSWAETLKNNGWITDFIGADKDTLSLNFSSNFTGKTLLRSYSSTPLSYHQAMIESASFKKQDQNSLVWIEVPSLLPPWDAGKDFLGPVQEELQDYFLNREEVVEDEEFPAPILNPGEDFKPSDDKEYLALAAGCAAAWAAVDDMLGAMVASIQEKYGEEDFSIIITSDRGSATSQHGVFGTKPEWLYSEFAHLPFLIYQPKSGKGGQRRMGYFQDVDLAPTLADICGISFEGYKGKSVMQTKFVEEGGRKFAYTHDSQTGSKVMRTHSRAYFLKPSEHDKSDPLIKYFVLPDDILEINDISKTELAYQEKIGESILLLEKDGLLAQEKIEALLAN